jgi:hypothetical protein
LLKDPNCGAFALEIEVDSSNDIATLRRAFEAACDELGIKIEGLDVPSRERLVERILTLLDHAS